MIHRRVAAWFAAGVEYRPHRAPTPEERWQLACRDLGLDPNTDLAAAVAAVNEFCARVGPLFRQAIAQISASLAVSLADMATSIDADTAADVWRTRGLTPPRRPVGGRTIGVVFDPPPAHRIHFTGPHEIDAATLRRRIQRDS